MNYLEASCGNHHEIISVERDVFFDTGKKGDQLQLIDAYSSMNQLAYSDIIPLMISHAFN